MSGEHKRKREANTWRPENPKRYRPDRPGNEHGGRKARYDGRNEQRRDDNSHRQNKAQKEILPSANELKTKIRDISRLLKNSDTLPADVRIEKERALEGYKRDLEKVEAKKARSNMISRYHFVRFLERKSAERKLNKLVRRHKELHASNDETKEKELAELEEQIDDTRTDLNYAMYSPLTEKYISLYPNPRNHQDPEESNLLRNNSGEKPPLWYVVKKCAEEGTLDLLREGKLNIGLSGEKKDESKGGNVMRLPEHEKGKKKAQGSEKIKTGGESKSKSSTGATKDARNNKGKRNDDDARMDSGDESEGGFFDE